MAADHTNVSKAPAAPAKPPACDLLIAASDKAGMDNIDRTRIDQIILRESGSSNYMQQQKKRDAAVNARIKKMQHALQSKEEKNLSTAWKRELEEGVLRSEIQNLISRRNPRSYCAVVDMDAFYMSCELLSHPPSLNKQPCCVGNTMILTSNYEARKFGVRSAMAGWIGDALVEELSGGMKKLIHLKSNFELYKEKSGVVREVLAEYDPCLRGYSLDEVYMDLGPYMALRVGRGLVHNCVVQVLASALHTGGEELVEDDMLDLEQAEEIIHGGDTIDEKTDSKPRSESIASLRDEANQIPVHIATSTITSILNEMRAKVTSATGGLTCSCGVASNHMLAKIGSDRNKPNGQFLVGPSEDDILRFVRPLAVRKIPGIGRVTDKILHAFGVSTVQDLYDQRATMRVLFQPATAAFLLRASIGWSNSDPSDNTNTNSSEEETSSSTTQKGISRERTFAPNQSWQQINIKLEELVHLLSKDMTNKGFCAHTVTLKVKLHTFDVISRSKSLPRGVFVQSAAEMAPLAAQMLQDVKKEYKGGLFSVRLLGVRCCNFQTEQDRLNGGGQLDISKFLRSPHRGGPLEKDVIEIHGRDVHKSTCTPLNKYTSVKKGGTLTQEKPRLNNRFNLTDTTPSSKQCISPSNTTITKKDSYNHTHNSSTSSLLQTQKNNCHGTSTLPQDQIPTISCPICGKTIGTAAAGGNDQINRHIDACLNSSMVREAVREESEAAKQRQMNHKKPRMTDFFKAR